MPPETPAVSVVIPLLDERATVDELLARVRAVLEARGGPFELVLVDDGSRDGTGERLREHEAEDARLRVFQFTRNFGQAAALACGVFAARGDVVLTLDGDLQNPPEEIPRLLDAVDKGFDLASGCRRTRYEGRLRRAGARAIHWIARWLLEADLRDVGGQFKAYRREVVEAVRVAWAPGKPIFPLALWLGFGVAEVEVAHDPRRAGESRYTLASLLRINADLITAFSTFPLTLLGLLGALCFGAGLCALALLGLAAQPGPVALAAALALVVSGAILLGMGVLGLYLGRVYRNLSGGGADWVLRRGPARDGAEGAP